MAVQLEAIPTAPANGRPDWTWTDASGRPGSSGPPGALGSTPRFAPVEEADVCPEEPEAAKPLRGPGLARRAYK